MSRPDTVNILGVGVSALNLETTVDYLDAWIKAGEKQYVCCCNVHLVMESRRSTTVRRVLNQAGMVTPDGMPLVWLVRNAGQTTASRVYGPDLMELVLSRSRTQQTTHFFYGGAAGVAQKLKTDMERRFPGVRVVGTLSPPVGSVEELATDEVAEIINAAQPDYVWVGIGCPKQEQWMAAMRSRLTASILVGVGAAFDFHTGKVSQAPRWMMRSGLEWLYRLAREPRRLWRRYLVYNPWFVWDVAMQKAGLRRFEIEAKGHPGSAEDFAPVPARPH
jgi:N-acetylglucosaminyldiphosphoundecaprenol N-acetyl-beta-D-mannosaminyltransferase